MKLCITELQSLEVITGHSAEREQRAFLIDSAPMAEIVHAEISGITQQPDHIFLFTEFLCKSRNCKKARNSSFPPKAREVGIKAMKKKVPRTH